jgi:hypothetical protein
MKKNILSILSLLVLCNLSVVAQTTIPAPYCTSDYADTPTVVHTYIKSVSMGVFSNVTNAQYAFPHYVFYNNVATTILSPGISSTIDLSFNVLNTAKYSLWIDYNKNYTFGDPVEEIAYGTLTASPNAMVSHTFIPPVTALYGITRLRIRVVEDGMFSHQSCGTFSNGETEDYEITIGQSPTSIYNSTDEQVELEIFPNPSKGFVLLRCNQNDINNEMIELYDVIGQRRLSIQSHFVNHTCSIDLNGIAAGIYYLKLGKIVRKIVIE